MFSLDSQLLVTSQSRCFTRLNSWTLVFLLYINDLPKGLNTNFKFPADLVTFTEETLNGKLHFLSSVIQASLQYPLRVSSKLTKF